MKQNQVVFFTYKLTVVEKKIIPAVAKVSRRDSSPNIASGSRRC